MNPYRLPFAKLFIASLFSLLLCLVAIQMVSAQETLAELKQKGDALVAKYDLVGSVPIYEKLVKLQPDNREFQFRLGYGLLAQAATSSDHSIRAGLRLRAREALVLARSLGDDSQLVKVLIESIPADGEQSDASFSSNKEAQALMQKGEAAFASGKMDQAFGYYQAALALDPKNYYAALFSGDVCVQSGKFSDAEIWYQKAIAIDPNIETAYRYSATPLMTQQKFDAARDRYIEAYIREPYNRLAIGGLVQWGQATNTKLAHPKIDIPASVGTSANGDINITLGMGDKDDDGSFAWTAYGMSRALWQSGKEGLSDNFKKAYPTEKTYRHSLAEEFDALKMTVAIIKERMADKKSKIKKLNPQLETLAKLYDAGLLEAYILMARPDEGIAQDHAAYLKSNPEKLRRYVVEYVLTGGGK
jgi:tetratricopeptide (TPR) repeat protein